MRVTVSVDLPEGVSPKEFENIIKAEVRKAEKENEESWPWPNGLSVQDVIEHN